MDPKVRGRAARGPSVSVRAAGQGSPLLPKEPVGLVGVKREPKHHDMLSLNRSPVRARGDSLATGTPIGDEKYLGVTKR